MSFPRVVQGNPLALLRSMTFDMDVSQQDVSYS